MEEIWKDIEGYTDYSVSNLGRIKSFKQFDEGRVLKLKKSKVGYMRIGLWKDQYQKFHFIHRLVGLAFIKNPTPKILIEVHHIDENKENNNVNNLEWVTSQYNIEISQSNFYKIKFPNNQIDTIFNLSKFCRKNNLSVGTLHSTFSKGWTYKGYQVLEIINQSGIVQKAKKRKIKVYKIICPNNKIEEINNLTKFSKCHGLDRNCMHRTLRENCFHRGYKILEINN